MSNMRVGKVSSVDYKNAMLNVVYTDKGNTVTTKLPYCSLNSEYSMPKVNEMVLVSHLTNGSSKGVVIGSFWNKKNSPPESGADLYRKDLSKTPGTAYLRYEDGSGELLVKGPDVNINAVNEATLGGPHVIIESNIDASFESPILDVAGGEDGLEINNDADITFNSEEKEIEATIKGVKTEIVEDYQLEAENISLESLTDSLIKAASSLEIDASEVKLKTSKHECTLDYLIDFLIEAGQRTGLTWQP